MNHTHPGSENPSYMKKNHPIRFVLEDAANTTAADRAAQGNPGYGTFLEEHGYNDWVQDVAEAVSQIREHTSTGNHGQARRLADEYVGKIARDLTPAQRLSTGHNPEPPTGSTDELFN